MAGTQLYEENVWEEDLLWREEAARNLPCEVFLPQHVAGDRRVPGRGDLRWWIHRFGLHCAQVVVADMVVHHGGEGWREGQASRGKKRMITTHAWRPDNFIWISTLWDWRKMSFPTDIVSLAIRISAQKVSSDRKLGAPPKKKNYLRVFLSCSINPFMPCITEKVARMEAAKYAKTDSRSWPQVKLHQSWALTALLYCLN